MLKHRTDLSEQRFTGFTLIELLVGIAIIGVLAAALVPAVSSMKIKAQRMESVSRLRALGTAFTAYAADHKGALPLSDHPSTGGTRWPIRLLPYVTVSDESKANAYSHSVFRPVSQEKYLPSAVGVFGYNLFFTEKTGDYSWRKLSHISDPAATPLLGTVDGELGGGIHLHVSGGPSPLALKYGYAGPTNRYGPAPVEGGKTLYLMADGHVFIPDEVWPWETTDGTDFHPKKDLSMSP